MWIFCDLSKRVRLKVYFFKTNGDEATWIFCDLPKSVRLTYIPTRSVITCRDDKYN